MYIVPPRPPPPRQRDPPKATFAHNLFAAQISNAPRATIQKRPRPQKEGQQADATTPTPRVQRNCKSTTSNSIQLPDTSKAAATDSRQPLLSSIGQKMQTYARKYYAQRLDQQSQQNLEAAALAQVQRDHVRAQQADRASLSHLERATAGLAKLTHCTPPFEPTLWWRGTRRTASPISDDYEVVAPSTPESVNGYESGHEDSSVFSDEYEFVAPRDPLFYGESGSEESRRQRQRQRRIKARSRSYSNLRPGQDSTTPSPETPTRRSNPRPTTSSTKPSTGNDIFHTLSTTNNEKDQAPPPPPPRYTISPRRDSVTGALQLSQQGSLAARMPDAETSDPKAYYTQQWLEGALAAAIDSPPRVEIGYADRQDDMDTGHHALERGVKEDDFWHGYIPTQEDYPQPWERRRKDEEASKS